MGLRTARVARRLPGWLWAMVSFGTRRQTALSLQHTLCTALDCVERRNREAIRQAFVDDVWKPFAAADMPQEEWSRIAEAMERTRPVAAMVVLAVFRQKMADEVEATFAQIAKRLSEGKN